MSVSCGRKVRTAFFLHIAYEPLYDPHEYGIAHAWSPVLPFRKTPSR